MNSDKKFACILFSKNDEPCAYATVREKNLKRHMKESHLGEKQKCECGKEMTVSSLIRHKKETCRLRKKNGTLQAKLQKHLSQTKKSPGTQ